MPLNNTTQRNNPTTTTVAAGDQLRGSALRRRYMPGVAGVAGISGPSMPTSKPSTGTSPTATIGGPSAQQPWSIPSAQQPWSAGMNKGGQMSYDGSLGNIGNANRGQGWNAGWNKPIGGGSGGNSGEVGNASPNAMPRHTSNSFGGFDPTQLMQRNGQWGMTGRGGVFQALGQQALARWLQHLASQPGGGGGPQPGGPPSGPILAQVPGYVTSDQFGNQAYDWFRNSQPAGSNDWQAFNDWFHRYGQQYDPTGWNRLYGTPTMWTGG